MTGVQLKPRCWGGVKLLISDIDMIRLIVLGHTPFGNCINWLDLLFIYVCEPFVKSIYSCTTEVLQ